MSDDLNTSPQGQRVWQFKNMTNPPETIPAYAVMARADLGNGTDNPDSNKAGDYYLDYWGWNYAVKPMIDGKASNVGSQTIGATKCRKVHRILQNPASHFFNLGRPVPPGGYGQCTFDMPAAALLSNEFYKDGQWFGWQVGSQVGVVDGYGFVGMPTAGVHEDSWALQYGYEAFSVFSWMWINDAWVALVTHKTRSPTPRFYILGGYGGDNDYFTGVKPGESIPISGAPAFWSDLGEFQSSEDTGLPATSQVTAWFGYWGWYLYDRETSSDYTHLRIKAAGLWHFDMTFKMGLDDVTKAGQQQSIQMFVTNEKYPDGRGTGPLGLVAENIAFDHGAPATTRYDVLHAPVPDYIQLPPFTPRYVYRKMTLALYLAQNDKISFRNVSSEINGTNLSSGVAQNIAYGMAFRLPG